MEYGKAQIKWVRYQTGLRFKQDQIQSHGLDTKLEGMNIPLEGFVPYKKKNIGKYAKFGWWLNITLGDMLDKAADIYPNK